MNLSRRKHLAGWLVLGGVLALPHALPAADLFLAPRLTLEVGYEDNRFSVASEFTDPESTAFLRATPALNLHLFHSSGTELKGGISAAHTEYLQSSLGAIAEAAAHIEWWQTFDLFEGGLRLATGLFQDDILPEDDYNWIALTPAFHFMPVPDWQLVAQAGLVWSTYDSREPTSSESEDNLFMEMRPGLRWFPSRNLSAGVSFYVENNRSNEDTSNFRGLGFAFDAGVWLTPRGQLTGSLVWGSRLFPDAFDEASLPTERTDMPMRVGMGYTHRLFPWLDLFCSGSWHTTHSDLASQDVSGWSLQTGMTFAQELEWPFLPLR